jgi:hypothetical protein
MDRSPEEVAAEITDYAEARVAIEKAGGTWHEEKGCLEAVLWFFLPITLLLLQLKGGN